MLTMGQHRFWVHLFILIPHPTVSKLTFNFSVHTSMWLLIVVCVDKQGEVYSRQSCSSESSSQSLSPSHTQERRMHLPLSQWKSTGEQVGSTANKQAQVSRNKETSKQSVAWREELASITFPPKNIINIFLFWSSVIVTWISFSSCKNNNWCMKKAHTCSYL